MEHITFFPKAGPNWISKDIWEFWLYTSSKFWLVRSGDYLFMFTSAWDFFVTLENAMWTKKIRIICPETSSVFIIQVCPIFIFAFSCNVWEPTLLLKYRFSTQLFEVELVHLAISKGLWIANLMKNSIYRRSISCRLYHFLLGQYLCFSQ